MNSLVQKAFTVWESDSIWQLSHEVWRFVCDTIEDRSSGYLQRVIVQLYWLPYGIFVRYSENSYCLCEIFTTKKFYFPQLKHHRRYRQQERNNLRQIYFESELAPLEEDDIVFDVGAFVGISSIAAAEKAKKVYAIEASPRSYDCLKKNTESVINIEPLHCAIYDSPGEVEFQLGVDASDDSLLVPDEGGSGETEIVPANTIQNLARDLEVPKIDLLKIEVEGVEPEVIDGIGDIELEKVVTNCDAEREGEKTNIPVKQKLSARDYEVTEGDHPFYTIVYGRKNMVAQSGLKDSEL